MSGPAAANLAIALAYFLIPIALLRQWPRLSPEERRLVGLAAAFVLSCGIGHGLAFFGAHRVLSVWHWVTALFSWLGAIALWRWFPKLLDAADLLREILRTTRDGCVVFDPVEADGAIADLRWRLVNRAASQILGRDDLVGKRHNAKYPQANAAYGIFDRYRAVLETGQGDGDEMPFDELEGRWIAWEAQRLAHTRSLLVTFADITQLKQAALRDDLTGLLNRRALFDRRVRANAIVLVDLDRFKTVNDTAGHAIGDEILRQVARRLERTIKIRDRVVRLGGDEFAIALTVAPPADPTRVGLKVAERAVATLAEPFLVDGRQFHLGASAGVAGVRGTISESLRQADLAMYRRKLDRNLSPVVVESPTYEAEMQAENVLCREFCAAIDSGALQLYYQPIVDLQRPNYPWIGFEALVRWQHPVRGLLTPGAFVPAVERAGLSHLLGDWVLRTAYRQAVRWSSPQQVYKMSINLSALDLNRPGFIDGVRQVLGQDLFDPKYLCFEITETAFDYNQSETVRETLAAIQALGAMVAIDDFGTGYSTLMGLTLPIDVLKIDAVFVRGDRADANLCEFVQRVAAATGRQCVAEGIETGDRARELSALGIAAGQGYYFARPMPAERVTTALKAAPAVTAPDIAGPVP